MLPDVRILGRNRVKVFFFLCLSCLARFQCVDIDVRSGPSIRGRRRRFRCAHSTAAAAAVVIFSSGASDDPFNLYVHMWCTTRTLVIYSGRRPPPRPPNLRAFRLRIRSPSPPSAANWICSSRGNSFLFLFSNRGIHRHGFLFRYQSGVSISKSSIDLQNHHQASGN